MVRTRFYPAWRAFADGREVPLRNRGGSCPSTRRRPAATRCGWSIRAIAACRSLALLALIGGGIALAKWPRPGGWDLPTFSLAPVMNDHCSETLRRFPGSKRRRVRSFRGSSCILPTFKCQRGGIPECHRRRPCPWRALRRSGFGSVSTAVREGLLMRHLVASALVQGLLMTCVSGSNAARGQAQLSSSRNASLFLRTDRAQYSLRDSIVIDVGVRNDGREPIYVYNIIAWGFGGGLVLWLRDHDDKVIEPVMRDDTMLPPPPAGDTSILSRLGPSMFIGERRTLEVKPLVTATWEVRHVRIEYRQRAGPAGSRPHAAGSSRRCRQILRRSGLRG